MQGLQEDIYIYIGKTKRDLATRVRKHFRNIQNGEIEKSAVAAHVWEIKKNCVFLRPHGRSENLITFNLSLI